jgi:WD40 repeat protein/uncharacterized caspase-like protein
VPTQLRAICLVSLLRLSLTAGVLLVASSPSHPQAPLQAAPPEPALSRPELVLQRGHVGQITSVAFSPDGKLLATAGGEDKLVKLWQVSTGLEIRTLVGHSGNVYTVAFSPDGQLIASSSADNTVRLWDVTTGRQVRVLDVTTLTRSVAFSPDGHWLVGGLSEGTIRLWDTRQNYISKDLNSRNRASGDFTERINALSFSADSRWIASAHDDKTARLWDVTTGDLKHAFGQDGSVTGVAFSPDGKRLATLSSDFKLRIWSTDNAYRSLYTDVELYTSLSFTSDGKFLVLAGGGGWNILDATNFHEIKAYVTNINTGALAVSPDGKLFATAAFYHPRLWNFSAAQELPWVEVHADKVSGLTSTRDGQWLAMERFSVVNLWNWSVNGDLKSFSGHSPAFNGEGTSFTFGSVNHGYSGLFIWALQGDKKLQPVSRVPMGGYKSVLSPDGNLVAWFETGGSLKLLDATTGAEKRVLRSSGARPSPLFSPDGKWIAFSNASKSVAVQDVVTGRDFVLNSNLITNSQFAFSPDGQRLAVATINGVGLWDFARSGALTIVPVSASFGIDKIRFSGDGKLMAVSRNDATIDLMDVGTGKEITSLHSPGGNSVDMVFAADQLHLITADEDGSIRIWDSSRGEMLATLAILATPSGNPDDKGSPYATDDLVDWAIVDAQGRFDASPRGMAAFHWIVGNETLQLSQLKERFYQPGLLREILGFNKEPLRSVATFEQVALYPEVKMPSSVDASGKLNIEIMNRGGGIGRVQTFVNGKELMADARPAGFDSKAKKATLSIDLHGALMPGEENAIRVVAWNQEGYLSSRGSELMWKAAGTADKKKPELYAIVSGISNYASPDLHLNFAAKDADDAAHAIKIAGERFFGADHVHIVLLSTTDKTGNSPSKANLQRAFEAASQSKPRDVLLVYLAGHGVARNDSYAYVTQEARTLELDDPAVLAQSAVTSEELVDWIKKIPALHQLMIIDTCAAGAAAVKLVEKRGVPGDQIRAIDRLKDRTGFLVLMGSAADSVSYEASQFGQGLLTYSLLEGMRGAALRDDEFVDVSRLFQYAADRVPELARNIGGIQRPQILAAQGSSFDVGKLLPEDKEQIPLAVVKPLILRPVLVNSDAGEDDLGLMSALRKKLRDESYAKNELIFVDADEMPNAIRTSGVYTVTGNKVVVNLVLRDGEKKARVNVEGASDDKDGVVSRIVSSILKATKSL